MGTINTLALLNSPIITNDGMYTYSIVDHDTAKRAIAAADSIQSYIGHQATAEAMGLLLDTLVPCNRAMFTQAVGQTALVFKLTGRLAEGKVLSTREEVMAFGYEFGLLTRLD